MAICGFDPNNIFGYTAKMFLVNKLDEPITFGAEKGSIDGEEYDPMWGEKVDANSIVYSDLHWYEFKDACKASGKDKRHQRNRNAGNYRQVLRWRYLGKRNLHHLPAGESR